MSQDLSVDLITHKLKIKWFDIKYIDRKLAQNIFDQIINPELKSITILNPETLTFISRFKAEIELIPIEWEEKTIEDIIYTSMLNKFEKERLRLILADRKKENKPVTEWIVKEILKIKFNRD